MNQPLPRWASAFLLPLLNLLSALAVAALTLYLMGESPAESLSILFNSAFLNAEGFGYTLFYASTFIFTGLSVAIAMQADMIQEKYVQLKSVFHILTKCKCYFFKSFFFVDLN